MALYSYEKHFATVKMLISVIKSVIMITEEKIMMIHCWECGEQISSSAGACPKCGASQNRMPSVPSENLSGGVTLKIKQPKPRVKYYMFMFVVAIVALGVVGVNFINSFSSLAVLADLEKAVGAGNETFDTLFALAYVSIGVIAALFIVLIVKLVFITQVKREELAINTRFGFSRAIFGLTIAALSLFVVTLAVSACVFIIGSGIAGVDLEALANEFTRSAIIPGALIGIYIPTLLKTIQYNGNIKKKYQTALASAQAAVEQ